MTTPDTLSFSTPTSAAAASAATCAVVIVNYKTPQLTLDCLHSLAPQIRVLPGSHILLVDNASPDHSASFLADAIRRDHLDDIVTLMPLTANGGYAAGNNAALQAALVPASSAHSPFDYLLLLNPDTIVRPSAIATLIAFMDAHPEVGIAGSRLEHPDGSPQPSAFRFHTIASEFEQGIHLGLVSRLLRRYVVAPDPVDAAIHADWVAGACMIIRRAVFDQIGLLDSAYFLYFEEVDFCLRAARRGWPCWYVPSARVVHLVGQASGVTSADRQQRPLPPYFFASRDRFFRKNHGPFVAFFAALAFITGHLLYRLRCLLTFRHPDTPPRLLRDFIRHTFLKRSSAAHGSTV